MEGENNLEKYIPLEGATKYCNYSQEYLSLRARQGKLKAIKFGRNWVTKKEWLEEYLGKVEEYNGFHLKNGNNGKKIGNVPGNLPVAESYITEIPRFKLPTLRFGFAIASVFILLTSSMVFGKESLKAVFSAVDPYVQKFNQEFEAETAAGIRNLTTAIKTYTYIYDVAETLFGLTSQSFKAVSGDLNNISQDIKLAAIVESENFGDPKDSTANVFKKTAISFVRNYIRANDFIEEKIAGGFLTAKDSISAVFSSFAKKYSAANEFVEQKIGEGVKKISQLFAKKTPAEKPVAKETEKSAVAIREVTREDIEILEEEIEALKNAPAKEVEVSRVTKIEPVKEITKEVAKIDDASLKQVRAQIIDLQEEVAKRLYAPGGVITQQIYVTQPVSSPKIYQENGDIVLQTAGSGNVILSAVTGMQISGKQVVIDSTSILNPLVYIADRTQIAGALAVGGATAVSGPITAQAITLNAAANYGKILDVQSEGTTKFSVSDTGAATLVGSFTITGNFSSTGDQDITGRLTVSAATSSTALTVTQSGTGNIVDFQDAGTSVFKITDGGYATLAVYASTTPAFLIRSPDVTWTQASSTFFGVNASSTFSGNFTDFQINGTSKFKVDESGNLILAGALKNAVTKIVAASSTANGSARADYICDGTNDEVEIQAAIDSLPSSGGVVKLLEGTYKISKRIALASNVILEGNGPGTNLQFVYNGSSAFSGTSAAGQKDVTVSDASVFAAGDYVTMFYIYTPSFYETNQIDSIAGNTLTMVNNLKYSHSSGSVYHATGLMFDTISKAAARNMKIGFYSNDGSKIIQMASTTDSVVENITFDETSSSIYIISSSTRNVVRNLYPTDTAKRVVVYIYDYSTNNYIENVNYGSFDINGSNNNTITKLLSNPGSDTNYSYLQNNANYNIISNSRFIVYGSNSNLRVTSDHNLIKNNIFEGDPAGSGEKALKIMDDADYNRVESNIFKNLVYSGGGAISFESSAETLVPQHNAIIDNDIDCASSTQYGIKISGQTTSSFDDQAYNLIQGNTIKSCTSRAIGLFYSSHNTITENETAGNGTDGILLYSRSNYTIISNNTTYQNADAGIMLEEENDYNVITGNHSYRNNKDGITIYQSSYNTVIGNEFLDNSQAIDNTYSDIRIWGTSGHPSTNNIINGNLSRAALTNRVKYGISEEISADDYNLIQNNQISGASTSAIYVLGTHTTVAGNKTDTAGEGLFNIIEASGSTSTALTVDQLGTGNIIEFKDSGASVFTITDGGNIGIGTTTPASTLQVYGTSTFIGGYVGIGTTTPFEALTIEGNLYGSGNAVFKGTMEMATTTVLANAIVKGNIVPYDAGGTYYLGTGSPEVRWDYGYFGELNALNITAASTSISGTVAQTFTINSDATGDENSYIEFYRGGSLTAAYIGWASSSDEFQFNFPIYLSSTGTISSANDLNFTSGAASNWTTSGLTIKSTGDITATTTGNINLTLGDASGAKKIYVTDSTGATSSAVFAVDSDGNAFATGTFAVAATTTLATAGGNVGIGTTTPETKLSVYGTSTFMGGGINIGTSTLDYLLAVQGRGYFSATTTIDSNLIVTGALKNVATKIVAATNTSNYLARADYVCSDNCATEIQNAVNALPTNGGVVYLLEGTYYLSRRIEIYDDNVSIIGSGFGTKLIVTSSIANIIGEQFFRVAAQNFHLSNMELDANGLNVNGVYAGAAWGQASGLVLENLNIKNVGTSSGYGVEVYGTESMEVNNATIRNNIITCAAGAYAGIYIYGYSGSNIITGNTISNGYNAIRITSPSSSSPIGGHNIIANNITASSSDAAIRLWGTTFNTVSNNFATSSKAGIYLDYSRHNTVDGNVTAYNSHEGIGVVDSTDNIISNNITYYNNDDGIYVAYYTGISADNNTIIGNNIFQNGDDGINIDTASYNSITGNTFRENSRLVANAYADIDISGTSTYNIISGNTFLSTSTSYVILESENGNSNIIANNIVGSTPQSGNFSLVGGKTVIYGNKIVNSSIGLFDIQTDSTASTTAVTVTQSGNGAIAEFMNTSLATATAFTITNIGSGYSFLVEDTTSTDATPFAIDADGNVGIATSSPRYKLDVMGNIGLGSTTDPSVPAMYVDWNTGKIGIGTTSPMRVLTVMNNSSAETGGVLLVHSNGSEGIEFGYKGITKYASGVDSDLNINAKGAGNLILQNTATGKVGIGTSTPVSLLNVYDTDANTDLTITVATDTTSYDPRIVFKTGGNTTTRFVQGVDFSDSNKYKIATSSLGTGDVLAIDPNTGFVGIATSAARYAFDVMGSVALGSTTDPSVPILYIDKNNQRIGIGTTSPQTGLHIGTNPLISMTGAANSVKISGGMEVDGSSWFNGQIAFDDNFIMSGGASYYLRPTNTDDQYFKFGARDNGVGIVEVARVASAADPYFSFGGNQEFKFYNSGVASFNGNVGMGTTTPASLLNIYDNDANADLTITVATDTTSYDPRIVFKTGGNATTRFVTGVDFSDSNKYKIATSSLGTGDVLAIDPVSGFVGIGTSSPASIFSVYGKSTFMGGDVGIGTIIPQYKLDIEKSIAVNTWTPIMEIENTVGPTGTDHGYSILRMKGGFNDAKQDTYLIQDAFSGTGGFGILSGRILKFETGYEDLGSRTTSMIIDISGNIGIGTTSPASVLEVYENSDSAQLTITVATDTTSYDPKIVFRTGGNTSTKFVTGVDFSDSNKFKIATSSLGTNDILAIDPSSGFVGIGTSTPEGRLSVYGTSTFMGGNVGIGTTDPMYKLVIDAKSGSATADALAIRNSGVNAIGQIAGLTFQYITSEPAAIRTTIENITTGVSRLGFFMSSDATRANLAEKVSITSSGNVGIGTTSPASVLNIYDNDANTDLTITVATDTTSYDPRIVFKTGGNAAITRFVQGVDFSDSNKYKIATSSLGTNDALVIDPTSGFVGIGTSTPEGRLSVYGASTFRGGNMTIFGNSIAIDSGQKYYFKTTDTAWFIGHVTASEDIMLGGSGLSARAFKIVDSSASNATKFSTEFLTGNTYIAGNVGIGTTSPASVLNIYDNDANTDLTITVATDTTSYDPRIVFKTGGNTTSRFAIGVDFSDSNKFKIATSSLGTNDILVIDSVTGFVGIGTSSPSQRLSVYGTSTFMGNVGIGAENPTVKLQVSGGNILLDNSAVLMWQRSSGGNLNILKVDNAAANVVQISSAGGGFNFSQENFGTSLMRIENTGYVGIGTTTPAALLDLATSSSGTALSINQSGAGKIMDLKYAADPVFTLTSSDKLKLRDALSQTWGSFNDVVLEDAEDNSVTDWVSSDSNNTAVTATTTYIRVNDYSMALKTTVGASLLDTATTTPGTTNWSSYSKLGFWIKAVYMSTSSAATTTDALRFYFKDSEFSATTSTTTLKQFGVWQYEEIDLSSLASAERDGISWYGFEIYNDYGSPTFYIDQMRLYTSAPRTSEVFVDSGGSLNLVSPSKIELTRSSFGDVSMPSLSVDSAVIQMNQPLQVNVGGDVGMSYDLVFTNTGVSTISSEGPLKIIAGDPHHYENLTLTTAGTGDVSIEIASSTIGFKVVGSDYGGYAFRVSPSGDVEIGGPGSGGSDLTLKQNLTISAGNITINRLGTTTKPTMSTTTSGFCASSTYYYIVAPCNDNGCASHTNVTASINTSADPNLSKIQVSFTAVAGTAYYKVWRSTDDDWTDLDNYISSSSAPNTVLLDNCTSTQYVDLSSTTNTSGGYLTIKGSIWPATTSSASTTATLGSVGAVWAAAYIDKLYGGDIIFANQFYITEVMTTSTSTPEGLLFKNASSTQIMAIDENGLLTVNKLAAKEIETEKITIKDAEISKTGITIFDRASGNPYCIFIENGEMQSVAGSCADLTGTSTSGSVLGTSTPESVPESIPESTSTSSTSSEPVSTSTPPDTIIDSSPATTTTLDTVNFEFHSTVENSTFQCKLNALDWSNCSSPKTYSGLVPADYNFQVFATNPQGDYDSTPAAYNWTMIEEPAPEEPAPEETSTSTEPIIEEPVSEEGSTSTEPTP